MRAWPDGVGRVLLREVDSTNAEAARRAPGLTGPAWILAESQTAGRGRRGRNWAMPYGNFAATLAVPRPADPPARLALRSFVAALGLHDALVAATGRDAAFAMKWPNDVLCRGGKIAGILLENTGDVFIVGVGVNLAAVPDPGALEPGAVPPMALTPEFGVSVAPAEFLDLLAPAYAHWEGVFQTSGFGPVRDAWMARAANRGGQMVARTMRDTATGTFETVDDDGCLVLNTASGPRAIAAADVFFA